MTQDPSREAKLKALDAAIERGLADVKAGRTVPIEEVFNQLQHKYDGQGKQDRERTKAELKALCKQIAAAQRTTPPPADEAEAWSMAIDQDTGRPNWAPKALLDTFWALRSKLHESGDDTETSLK